MYHTELVRERIRSRFRDVEREWTLSKQNKRHFPVIVDVFVNFLWLYVVILEP